MTNEEKKAKLAAVFETLNRHSGYDLDWIVKELRAVDAQDSQIQEAIAHILGANGKGEFRRHEPMQNLRWARTSLRSYMDEKLES